MGQITFYADEHRQGDLHYHLETDLGVPKIVFMKFKEKLPDLLPPSFNVKYYGDGNDIGILDEKMRQHMRIWYVQRRFPHSLHITFLRPSFKPVFTEMLKQCFPSANIEWVEIDTEDRST